MIDNLRRHCHTYWFILLILIRGIIFTASQEKCSSCTTISMFSTLFHWCLVDSCTGNGRGGESIYGGFFEGIRALAYLCQMLKWGWMYNLGLFFQMKALLSSTIRSTCCQWPIEAKIQMDHSFSCKYPCSSWIYGLDLWHLYECKTMF